MTLTDSNLTERGTGQTKATEDSTEATQELRISKTPETKGSRV